MSSYIPKKINLKLKGSHFDFVNNNYVYYTENAVQKGSESWIKPFRKPQLIGHNKDGDPVGRVTGYEIVKDKNQNPPNYVRLFVEITDKDAIEKVLDGRYNTVSVGSRTNRVICSECSQVLTEDGLCEHKKGSFNRRGDPIHWIVDQITYTEDSFVNDPADPYAGIEEIDIGDGFVDYTTFLDNREALLGEFQMEDNFNMNQNDAKLSYKSRENLPDSAFCYVITKGDQKIRKFPAHDAAHVRNGLARLPQANLDDGAKNKILACLKRRAKRFDIQVADSLNIDETFGLDDGFTKEEQDAVTKFFEDNPTFDQIDEQSTEPKKQEQTDSTADEDISKMKKEDLIQYAKEMQDKLANKETELAAQVKKVSELEDEIKSFKTVLTEREDEVNRYLDKISVLDKKFKDSIIKNIIDLKKTDNKISDLKEFQDKLSERKIDSLIDTLTDLRSNINLKIQDRDEGKIPNPVVNEDGVSQASATPAETKENKEPETDEKFSLFKQER